jgi:hypothetical protein
MQVFAGYDPANNPLNTNEWAFPVCEVLHIVGFAMLIGTITIVDLRLLGVGMRRQTAAELVRDTAPWTLLGLMLVLTTGPLIFSSGPATYVYNSSFHYKMTALAVGILYNWTVHKKVANSPDPGGLGVLVGAFSMLLWASIIFAGIFIAFV